MNRERETKQMANLKATVKCHTTPQLLGGGDLNRLRHPYYVSAIESQKIDSTASFQQTRAYILKCEIKRKFYSLRNILPDLTFPKHPTFA
jgi:hypothetical protein